MNSEFVGLGSSLLLSHHFLRQEVTLLYFFFHPGEYKMSANNFLLRVIHAVDTSISSREELKFYSLVLPATETRISYDHVGLMAHVYLQNFQKVLL